MTLLANVALTDTFDIWRQRTNQIIIELDRSGSGADGAFTKANQVGAAVTTANGNITSAFLKANQVGQAVTTANSNITGVSSNVANLGGAITTANSNITTANANINAAFLKANQVGEAVTTANSNITAAFLKANQVGAAVTTANGNITAAFNKANTAAPVTTLDTVNTTRYIVFDDGITGTLGTANVSYGLSYNPSTNTISSVNLSLTGNSTINSLGVGTNASGVAGEIRATNDITAYYSDSRLKKIISTIPNPLERVNALSGVLYINNEVAERYGYDSKNVQVGVIAQEVESVLPEVVKLAPFDTEYINGVETSKSGENYKTVQYEKLIPLLIESIKELDKKLDSLEHKLNEQSN